MLYFVVLGQLFSCQAVGQEQDATGTKNLSIQIKNFITIASLVLASKYCNETSVWDGFDYQAILQDEPILPCTINSFIFKWNKVINVYHVGITMSDSKRKNCTWTGIRTSDLQISILPLYQLSDEYLSLCWQLNHSSISRALGYRCGGRDLNPCSSWSLSHEIWYSFYLKV